METICDCGHVAKPDGISTGYGVERDTGKKICNECCGILDKEYLLANGKLSGYFSKNKDGKWEFSNWPGTFRIPAHYAKKSNHNFAGRNGRTDFWCTFEGDLYHGVQIGHLNECATIRKIKG